MSKYLYFILGSLIVLSCTRNSGIKTKETIPSVKKSWAFADSIKSNIEQAVIPTDSYLITKMDLPDNPYKIQLAINKIADMGGGTLILSEGVYHSAAIEMKSKTAIYLEAGAVLKFIPDPELYPLKSIWFSGIPCMNYSSLIYAKGANDIKISGKGIIDGQGNDPVWSNMKYKEPIEWDLLNKQANEQVPVANRKFGTGHSLRPDLIAFYECSRLTITDLNIINSPYFCIHPVRSNHITLQNCNIRSSGYEQVGLAIESTQNMLVEGVVIKENGEGIKFLSGRIDIPDNQATSNVVVQNCSFQDIIYSPVTFSSTSYAGLHHVYLSGLKIDNTGTAFRFYGKKETKTNHIFMKDISARNITGSFLYFRTVNANTSTPILSAVSIENCTVENCGRAFLFQGTPANPIQAIYISDSRFNVSKGSFITYTEQIELNRVTINHKVISAIKSIGHNEIPEIYLKSPEDEILETDQIQYKVLPTNIKNVLHKKYPSIPITDIERIKTSSKVIYNIDLEIKPYVGVDIVVQQDGELLCSKDKIQYTDLPEQVNLAIKDYLGLNPNPFIFNKILQVNYSDFTYYEITGEYNQKLFALGISEEGKIIEKKQQRITNYFKAN